MPRISDSSNDDDGSGVIAPHHEIAPGLLGYEWVLVESTPSDGLPYAVTATVEPENGKYSVTKIVIERQPGGIPVQRGELAKISVEPFIREVARHVHRTDSTGKRLPMTSPQAHSIPVRGEDLSDETLAQLAAQYRWIRLQDGRPTARLAANLGVSTATVKRWLAKAVDAGHLTQEERTK